MVPELFPFPGLRYQLDATDAALGDLTAPPYDVIDAEARARLEAAHPNNAVRLILPRDQEPGDRYQRAREAFDRWRARGVLAADPPRFYLYRMTFTDDSGQERRMVGVIGALALAPPGAGEVLPHERTMPKPRGDRLELLRAVRANLDPVWCLSLASGFSDLLEPDAEAGMSCVDADGVEHCLFPATEAAGAEIAAAVASAPIVVADGHHRYETALAYQAERRESGAADPGADRIMTLVVELTEDHLWVRPIHRLLSGVGPSLRGRLATCFTVEPAGANAPEAVRRLVAEMERREAMGLIDGEGLALLLPRLDVLGPDFDQLPEPLRGIDAARLDAALTRIGGSDELDYSPDAAAVAAMVTKRAVDAAILLRPPSVAQIDAVAEAGERMPAKTTFFQPKPLTGLVFRSLDD